MAKSYPNPIRERAGSLDKEDQAEERMGRTPSEGEERSEMGGFKMAAREPGKARTDGLRGTKDATPRVAVGAHTRGMPNLRQGAEVMPRGGVEYPPESAQNAKHDTQTNEAPSLTFQGKNPRLSGSRPPASGFGSPSKGTAKESSDDRAFGTASSMGGGSYGK